MKRLIAGALIGLVIMEAPSCGESKGGGSGDINYPDAKPLSSAPAKTEPSRGANPSPKSTRPLLIGFRVLGYPNRDMTITWQINGKGATEKGSYGTWELLKDGRSGDVATLTVESGISKGFTSCTILVDGKIQIPNLDDKWNPYMHRNDHGDCKVSAIVR